MRYLAFILALIACPAAAQVAYPPDPAVAAAAAAADAKAAAALTAAQNAQTAADSSVKSVNAINPVSGNVTIPLTQFVSGFNSTTPGTIANLMANAPCNASRVAQYAVVSDLYGGATATNEVMRCGQTGTMYYWRPQRTDFSITNSTTSGTVSLTPLLNAPTLVFTGSLLGNISVTPSTQYAWPGASFTVINKGVLGLFGINLTGITGGTLGILAGGQRTIYYTCDTSAVCSWQGY